MASPISLGLVAASVDRLYRRSDFASERERVEQLFMLYEEACIPLEAGMKRSKRAPKR